MKCVCALVYMFPCVCRLVHFVCSDLVGEAPRGGGSPDSTSEPGGVDSPPTPPVEDTLSLEELGATCTHSLPMVPSCLFNSPPVSPTQSAMSWTGVLVSLHPRPCPRLSLRCNGWGGAGEGVIVSLLGWAVCSPALSDVPACSSRPTHQSVCAIAPPRVCQCSCGKSVPECGGAGRDVSRVDQRAARPRCTGGSTCGRWSHLGRCGRFVFGLFSVVPAAAGFAGGVAVRVVLQCRCYRCRAVSTCHRRNGSCRHCHVSPPWPDDTPVDSTPVPRGPPKRDTTPGWLAVCAALDSAVDRPAPRPLTDAHVRAHPYAA